MKYCNTCGIDEDRHDKMAEWIRKHARHSSDCYSLRNFERDCDCGLYELRPTPNPQSKPVGDPK